MPIRQVDHGSGEYLQMIQLREEILRKPLKLSFSPEELENERDDMHIGAFDDDELLGCCLLTRMNAQTIRLRQMAVINTLRGKGIGASMLFYAENLARDHGYSLLTMHARNSAIGFYSRMGYNASGEQFIEVTIPHYLMQKRLI